LTQRETIAARCSTVPWDQLLLILLYKEQVIVALRHPTIFRSPATLILFHNSQELQCTLLK
ncbi:hypothetical protein L0F63_003229, partial [Massospora cicadina]